ncbi:MAG: response regulator [Candidatus Omnitrophota bacterium]
MAGRKILVVDDEERIVNTLEGFFSAKGEKMFTAFSGEEALKVLEEEGPDVMLLDIQMPKVNGIEVLKFAKQGHRSIKIIVVTGHGDEYRDEVMKLGADAMLTKPFGIKVLTDKIDEVMGEQKPQKDISKLLSNPEVFAKARLLFMQGPSHSYKAERDYFLVPSICKGVYDVSGTVNEGEALTLLETFKPDIVIADLNVLGKTKLISKIMESKDKPREIIVYGSSFVWGAKSRLEEYLREGAVYVGKQTPFTRDKDVVKKLSQEIKNAAFRHGLYVIVKPQGFESYEEAALVLKVKEKIIKLSAELLKVRSVDVTMDSVFADLGADDLDVAELGVATEQAFNITVDEKEVTAMKTVGMLVGYLVSKIKDQICR